MCVQGKKAFRLNAKKIVLPPLEGGCDNPPVFKAGENPVQVPVFPIPQPNRLW